MTVYLLDGVEVTIPGITAPPVAVAGPRYVPVPLARERLEAAGKWAAVAGLIASDPATMLKLVTLRDGLDAADPAVRALLAAAGADADAVLAP